MEGHRKAHSYMSILIGDKTKARDILTAICTLQSIEQQQKAATPEERKHLTRFRAFGAVALSLFLDPVTGRTTTAGNRLARNLRRYFPPGSTIRPSP